nr:PKD domain-containing protein [Candidatus Njordarchaeum guaymaensis]
MGKIRRLLATATIAIIIVSLLTLGFLLERMRFGIPSPPVTVYHTSPGLNNSSRVPRFEVFELTFIQSVDYGGQNNFFDINIRVTFTAPISRKQTIVGGFYYDTLADGSSLWKVRFAPSEVGTWTYNYTFTHTPTRSRASGGGSFDVISSLNRGFLRPNPLNPYRWEFADGQPFVPIGTNDCISLNDLKMMDGGDRNGSFLGGLRTDECFKTFSEAGFNMFRFSQANCGPNLANSQLDTFDKDVAMYFDWLMQQLRAYNFRIFYGFFGYLLPDNPTTPPTGEVLRFIDYSINRWGAYVDIWELQNERTASDAWIRAVAQHLRANDPYAHPITTSWQRPDIGEIEVNAPHWYAHENELQSDLVTANKADSWKQFGKPVIVGEQGNSGPQGEFSNWLPDSALRMRIRCWTAFFEEISFLFWDTSWATNGHGGGAANIYLGPEERQYIQVLQWFSNMVIRPDTKTSSVGVSDGSLMRAYSLSSSDGVAVYAHHYGDHISKVIGEAITIDIPIAGQGYWIDPSSGQNLAILSISKGLNTLTVPDFTIDVAFFSTATPNLNTPPIAIVKIDNPQADGDLDDDGLTDYGPSGLPFGIPPLTLNFDAKASYDLDGGALSYLWHFGDGSADEAEPLPKVTHTYAAGTYLTTLTVIDDEGYTASQSFVVRATGDPNPNINNAPSLNRLRDIIVREGEMVLLTPSASDSELERSNIGSRLVKDNLTYSVSGLPAGASFGQRGADWSKQFWWVPSFSQSGVYTVEFKVQDDKGVSAVSQKVTITVLDAPQM